MSYSNDTSVATQVARHAASSMSVNLMALLYLGVDALGVIKPLLTYLALDKHAATVSAKCFFQLRQLRRVRRSLDRESAATLFPAHGNLIGDCHASFVMTYTG